jgi:hypothetical protein
VLPRWIAISVPKITVDEYSEFVPHENQIRTSRERLHISTKAKSFHPQLAGNQQFNVSSFLPYF